jgi:DNA repair protein RecO
VHHIYHTEGIILGSRNTKEADKYFYIFTRDLGMIYATAQGVRKISSKLRFVLQDYAYVKLDIVSGKEIFRITSASKTNLLQDISKNAQTFKVFVKITSLLKRLLSGVEKNEILFDDLLNNLFILEKAKNIAEIQDIETIIVLRMLNNLGYIGGDDVLQDFIKSPFSDNMIFEVSKHRNRVINQINKALKETHL